jgi:16S rRNA processing protein RimM
MPAPKAPATVTGNPGSPSTGEPVYLAVGLLRKPHGVHGDILLTVYTDFPDRLRPGTVLFFGDEKQPFKITRRRPHNDGLILGFGGIPSPEQAAKLTGKTAFVRAEDRPPLSEGEYYHHQIIGLSVLDESGSRLGVVTEILVTGANDVYVVEDENGREVLLPALKETLLEINLNEKTMRVHLLPGLLDEESSAS